MICFVNIAFQILLANSMIANLKKSDTFGILISSLCLIHCLFMPLLLIFKGSLTYVPSWWKGLDYIFLLLSFLAVYRSTQTTSKAFMKVLFWGSWFVLTFVILNEKLELLPLPEVSILLPTLSLIFLHEYNRRYCTCATDKCCTK